MATELARAKNCKCREHESKVLLLLLPRAGRKAVVLLLL